MNSIIKIPACAIRKAAEFCAALEREGIRFDCVLGSGEWVITLIGS